MILNVLEAYNKKTEVRLLGKLSSLRTQLFVFETDKILTFQTNQ